MILNVNPNIKNGKEAFFKFIHAPDSHEEAGVAEPVVLGPLNKWY
jgi:hypothetical protein